MAKQSHYKIVKEFVSGGLGVSTAAALYAIISIVVGSATRLSGAALITTVLSTLGFGTGMAGGLGVLLLTGIGSATLVRLLAEKVLEKYPDTDEQ